MSQDTGRQPLETLGTEDSIFGFEIDARMGDLWLVPVGLMVGVVVAITLEPVSRQVGMGGFVLVNLLTWAYIYVTRDYDAPHKYLAAQVAFWRGDTETRQDASDESKRPGAMTHVVKVDPQRKGTVREDGALVAEGEVEASPMALATSEQWHDAVEEYAEHCNNIQFPTATSVRGRPVDPSIMTDGLADRMTDPDVEDVPALKEMIRTYQREWPIEFVERGTCVRQYRVGVPVSMGDAQLDGHGAIAKLGELPGVGGAIRELGGELARKSTHEIRDEQASILDRRMQTVLGAHDDLGGGSARRLPANEHGDAIEHYWMNTMPRPTTDPDPQNSRFTDGPRVRRGSDLDVGGGT